MAAAARRAGCLDRLRCRAGGRDRRDGWRITTFIIRKSHMYEIEPWRGGFFYSAGARFVALAAIVVALDRPLHADLLTSQVYTLLALLYALWLYGYLTRCDWLCGAALAGLALPSFRAGRCGC